MAAVERTRKKKLVALTIAVETANVLKKLQQLERQIPKVTSRAMQLASEQARDDARKSAQRKLDRPRPATLKAIRNRWPSRGAVIAGKANAAVWIIEPLVDELHPNVFGGREKAVPKSGKTVISPTKDFKTNKYGNIAGLRGNGLKRRRSSKKFLDVPLNNRNRKTLHLPPGLYQIKGGKRSRQLVMIVSYNKSRTITDPKWREYPSVVSRSFDKHYKVLWRRGWRREIAKLL